MKPSRALSVAPLLLLFLLISAACVSTEEPQGWAAPAFDGQNIVFVQRNNRLAAAPLPGADATSLSIAWSFPDKNNPDQKNISIKGIYGDPVVDGDRVYLTTYDGGVFALEKASGKPAWRVPTKDISGNVVGGVGIGTDLALFGTTDGHLYALKKADGSPADGWKSGMDLGSGVWAAPLVKDGIAVVATMNGDIRAIDLATRAEKWRFKASGAVANLEFLPDGRIFAPSLNRHVYFIDAATGAQKGDFVASGWVWTQPAVKDNVAYFGDFEGNVYALDISQDTPTQRWKYNVGSSRVKSGPQIADDVVVIADRSRTAHFVNAKDGSLLNRVPFGTSGTARADLVQKDGFVYVSTTDGGLFRADPAKRSVVEIREDGRQ